MFVVTQIQFINSVRTVFKKKYNPQNSPNESCNYHATSVSPIKYHLSKLLKYMIINIFVWIIIIKARTEYTHAHTKYTKNQIKTKRRG